MTLEHFRKASVFAVAALATASLNELSFQLRQRRGMSAFWQRASGVLGFAGPTTLVGLQPDMTNEDVVTLLWLLMVIGGGHYAVRTHMERDQAQRDGAARRLAVARS